MVTQSFEGTPYAIAAMVVAMDLERVDNPIISRASHSSPKKMRPHIGAPRKGISPVIATVILVAVAITASVSIAYWMGGISTLYTTQEKIEITGVVVSKGASNYTIGMNVRNTGSKDATIDSVYLNQKLSTQYGSLVNIESVPSTVLAGGSNTVVIRIGDISTPPFTPGTTIEVKLHTAAGKEYPLMVALT
jgi:flagellin-like protein